MGVPAPQYLDVSWKAGKSSYVPGEAIVVELKLTNVRELPIRFSEISVAPLLDNVDTRANEMIPLMLANTVEIPELMQPGEEIVVLISASSVVTSTLPTGRYTVHLDVSFVELDGTTEMSDGTKMGLNSGTLFVIAPPEGTLIRTVQVGEVRRAGAITMTLESLSFTAEETKIIVIVTLPDLDPAAIGTSSPDIRLAPVPTVVAPDPARAVPTPTAVARPPITGGSAPPGDSPVAPMPTRLTSGRGNPTPAPTATPAPQSPGSTLRGATASYRIDGGAWQELASFGHRGGPPEAVRLVWTLGPVSSTARTFDFAVTGVRLSADEEVAETWEWSVPLQNE